MQDATSGAELLGRFGDSLGFLNLSPANVIVIVIGIFLIWLGIKKKYEPLLLIPIGFKGICNKPV